MLLGSLGYSYPTNLKDFRCSAALAAAHTDSSAHTAGHVQSGRGCRVAVRASASGGGGAVADVVLTREAGKNGDLARRLRDRSLSTLEVPLVETGPGPDRKQLLAALRDEQFDYIIVTSPESASVFVEAWQAAGQPQVKVAVVGDGTGRELLATGQETLKPVFVPTKANAVHLSAELPLLHSRPHRVLYPASAKAGSNLQRLQRTRVLRDSKSGALAQRGLAARGVEVVRLNTYTTRQVASLEQAALQQARGARVLSIASPSAIKAWVQLAGREKCPAVACIGTTSSNAALELGLGRVFTTESPGMDGWVEAIQDALDACSAPAQ